MIGPAGIEDYVANKLHEARYIVFVAEDGNNSIRVADGQELAKVAFDAIEEYLKGASTSTGTSDGAQTAGQDGYARKGSASVSESPSGDYPGPDPDLQADVELILHEFWPDELKAVTEAAKAIARRAAVSAATPSTKMRLLIAEGYLREFIYDLHEASCECDVCVFLDSATSQGDTDG